MFNTGGGGRGLGHFQTGLIRESREITLRNARRKIEALAQQLSLRRDRIDMAFHFFKLALNKHLTRGRKSTHVIAACVYITCRTESTPHMLIDFSDILQIDVYELGRTFPYAMHVTIKSWEATPIGIESILKLCWCFVQKYIGSYFASPGKLKLI